MHQNYTGIIGEALTLISRKHDSKNKVPKAGLLPLQIHLQIFLLKKTIICIFTMIILIKNAQPPFKPFTQISA